MKNISTHLLQSISTNTALPLKRRSLSLAVTTVLAFVSAGALAQDAVSGSVGGIDDEELDVIVVTSRSMETTMPIELAKYGADVEFLTEEAIENHGFFDVIQAVEMLTPGVHLSSQAGAFSYVDLQINGSRSTDVLWTVDGVRINNRLYNSTSPADTLPAAMIERTEIMSGGHGLIYGTQAVAGVMNVVTRSFSDELTGSVQVGMDSNSGQHHNGYVSGSVGNNKLIGWMSRDETDGYEIFDFYNPSVSHRERGYEVDSFGVKYGYDFSDELSVTVTNIHTDAALQYPSPTRTSVNDREEDITIARLDYAPSTDMSFYVKSYYHNWDTNYYNILTGPGTSAYWGYKDKGLGAGGQIDFGQGLEVLAGLDYQAYEGEDEVWIIAKQEEKVKAGFFQVRTTDDMWVNTRVAAGLRRNKTGGSDNTVWSVSGEHYLSESLYVEAVYGTSFVLPSAENLYLADPCCGWHGNPNLEAEESEGIDYGIGGQIELGEFPLNWKLSGWNRTVDNLIDWGDADELGIEVPDGYNVTSFNRDGETKVSGWDVILRGELTEALSFSYNYTRSKEENNGVQLTNRARNNQKFSVSFAPPGSAYGVDLAAKYVGDATITGSSEVRDAYMVANLGAHMFLDQNRNHRINFRVENLLDEDYATRYYTVEREVDGMDQLVGRLGPERTYSLSYTFGF